MQDGDLELARMVVAQLEQAANICDDQAQDYLTVLHPLHDIQVTEWHVDYLHYFLYVVHDLLVTLAQGLYF